MLITLSRTGGIIPITKKADAEVDWTHNQMEELLKAIKKEGEVPGEQRDATSYELQYKGETFPVNLEKVPDLYKKTFDNLKEDLKISKPGG